jgi:hypothetical protein
MVQDQLGNNHIFKACDQEPSIPEKQGVEFGHGAQKEVAAYLMDRSHAGVPRTSFVSATLTKNDCKMASPPAFGSLQKHVENIGTTDDFSSSLFETDDVHRIGILDVRLFNLDRHLGNLLVIDNRADPAAPKKYGLVPIDHAYTLPDFRSLGDANFEWGWWKQTEQPFSRATLEHIEGLDILADAGVLDRLGLRDGSIITMILSTMLLKHYAAQGMTLAQIAKFVQRDGFGDELSPFELMVSTVREEYSQEMAFKRGLPPTLADEDLLGFKRDNSSNMPKPNSELKLFLNLFQKQLNGI